MPKSFDDLFPRCGWHKPSRLSYSAAEADAERRLKRGEEQRYCGVCKRWYWAHEWGGKPEREPDTVYKPERRSADVHR